MWGNVGEELAGVREGIRELIEEKEEKKSQGISTCYIWAKGGKEGIEFRGRYYKEGDLMGEKREKSLKTQNEPKFEIDIGHGSRTESWTRAAVMNMELTQDMYIGS